jgi:hypothetical protein
MTTASAIVDVAFLLGKIDESGWSCSRHELNVCIFIGCSKYLNVHIFTFEVQILGNIWIQIQNICTPRAKISEICGA